MKKWLALLLALCLGLSLMACGKEEAPPASSDTAPTQPTQTEAVHINVAISMPNDTNAYWLQSARMIKEQLEAQDQTVAVLFAENSVENQQRHIREMLLNQVDCMVVAAIDSFALTEELADAKAAGIPVIAFDRLIMGSDAVSGLVAYDYEAMGADMAQQVVLERKLNDPEAENRPYTIEFFMDTPENYSSMLLHKGAMGVLRPYLDSGALVCCSGRLEFEDACVPEDDYDTAWAACVTRLHAEYTERYLDICFAGSDLIADACRGALTVNGHVAGKHLTVAGQGGGLTASKAIANGKQAVTIYKDVEALAAACAEMAVTLISGQIPEGNTSQDNYAVSVPAVFLPYTVINRENYTQELVDTGIYTDTDLPPQPTEAESEPTEATQPSSEETQPSGETGEATQPSESTGPTETTA